MILCRYNGTQRVSEPTSTITYRWSSLPSRQPSERAIHETCRLNTGCKFCWNSKRRCNCQKLQKRKDWALETRIKGGIASSHHYEQDDDIRAVDNVFEEHFVKYYTEIEFDLDWGDGCSSDEASSSCSARARLAPFGLERVDFLSVGSISSACIISDDECDSSWDSIHLSSCDDVVSSSDDEGMIML